MRQATKLNLKITAAVLISIPIFFGVLALADWVFPGSMRLLNFIMITMLVFGALALRFHRDAKNSKCVLLFLVLLGFHCAVFQHYYHRGIIVPNLWYPPIAAVETILFGLILIGLGGAHDEENDDD